MPGEKQQLGVLETQLSSIVKAGTLSSFQDDASLPIASSTIKFRATGTMARVYPDPQGQFIIQDDYDEEGKRKVVTKRLQTSNMSLMGLRATYSLVALFYLGFLVVFSLELLLYLVLDMTIEFGATSKGEYHPGTALGALLAFPLYIHGLACALIIGTFFVQDTWEGHTLVKRFVFGRFSGVVTEWISFVGFLGIPLVILIITLFAGLDNWWEITSLAWFSCITIFYLMFAITIVAFENRACWEVTRNRFDDDDDSWPHVIRRAILMRQRNLFGGRESTTYMAKGSIDDGLGANKNAHIVEETHTATKSLYSKIVALPVFERLGLFENLEVPKRQWTLEDVRQERPFVTAETWSLEAVYCRPTQSRYVAVLRGPQALTRPQLRSSIYCALIGQAISILILASILWWLDLPGLMIMTVVILVVLFGFYPSIKNSWRLFKMTKEFVLAQEAKEDREAADNEAEEIPEQGGEEEPKQGDENPVGEGDEIAEKPRMQLLRASAFRLAPDESEGLYQVWEIHRITNVTERMCWILFGLEFFFLFLWPLAALFIIGNYATSVLFFFVALFSALRSYFNAAIVLEETGTLDLVDGEPGSREFWLNKSRLSTIVSKITRAPSRMAWMGILCFFLIAFLGLFGLAVTQPADSTSDFQFVYLPDFEYEQADDLPYPTCSFGKGLASLGSPTTLMADYAFLAALAYRDPTITQGELDQWFGNGTAVDQQEFVDNYRNSSDTVKSAVSYKLITFPEAGNLAMLCIRGTTNAWDALTDAQLWAAAAIFQALRVLLPLGSIWTPIMHRLINVVSWLASDSINKVAFYKETSRFVRYLQGTDLSNTSVGVISNIQVTGHSLGGGLSIITGAQTNVAAVALSGPNALLSRESFDPPLTEEALNTLTFNIVPDRDVVPRFDDVAKLNQRIRCLAPVNDPIACHDGRRSLCEILYTCGTGIRPALCDCVTEFSYPQPKPKNTTTRTFEQACASLITP